MNFRSMLRGGLNTFGGSRMGQGLSRGLINLPNLGGHKYSQQIGAGIMAGTSGLLAKKSADARANQNNGAAALYGGLSAVSMVGAGHAMFNKNAIQNHLRTTSRLGTRAMSGRFGKFRL